MALSNPEQFAQYRERRNALVDAEKKKIQSMMGSSFFSPVLSVSV